MECTESLLLLEVELMETSTHERIALLLRDIASIIGSGINGNLLQDYKTSHWRKSPQSLLLLEVELMET